MNLSGKWLPKILAEQIIKQKNNWFQDWILLFKKYRVDFTGEVQNIKDWPELTNKLLIKIKSTFRVGWDERAEKAVLHTTYAKLNCNGSLIIIYFTLKNCTNFIGTVFKATTDS